MGINKLLNRIKLFTSYVVGQTYSRGLPHCVIIEPTNFCDKSCQLCPNRSLSRPRGMMELDLFKKIIDQLPLVELVFPYLMGEPLLHKDIFQMLSHCKSKGMFTSLSTGGKPLNQENSKKLIASGLDHLLVSLNADHEEGYKAIDSTTDFHLLLDNVERFLSVNNGKINFTLSVINTKIGLRDWKKFKKEWEKKGANVRFKFFSDWKVKDPAIEKFGTYPSRPRNKVYPCDWLWRQLHVLWDGSVVPCCFDYDRRHVLGNMKTQSLSEIWNGEEYLKIRQSHLIDGSKVPLCFDCNRRKIAWYEIPFLACFSASFIYKLRLLYEGKPRGYYFG